MKEQLLERDFGTQQLKLALDYFTEVGIEGCIYCGSKVVERWDHLVPVSAGGGAIVGNMVPACQPCDDSKGGKDYLTWLAGSAKKNPARNRPALLAEITVKVDAYRQHFNYVAPADFREALNAEQLAQYEAFLHLVSGFRTHLTQLGLVTLPLPEIAAGWPE